ncbi:ABC transporter ATP-binding protein [Halorientalis pallida]|uniref:Molybdate/tungstate import ATP-binding protein WtpC n=1 Tax=Halorientalis pallida TaxID=2479928 RepID=A0A498KZF3_9EURY|nr:ABC transporter ATP-binding protein [Halorientalis pallida]RXK47930.1 ABC transporter ATP-binding protein [Halorientalis pallida]
MSSEPAVSIDDLSKRFSNETVLQDISLDIETGEFCVIMGPSGSGKSTFLRCIAGLIEHQSGSIAFDGTPAETIPVEERELGYVFQEFEDALFPHKTVGENVIFGLEQQDTEYSESEIDERIDEMLDLLAISHTRDDVPTELSGGQQQRVELARQLVRECDVMLLDDPLADLDYKLQKRMELEIRQLHQEMSSTFLYVTHNQDQALKLADKLVILNHGRIEQIGTPEEIYHNPASAFVGQFVGDSNPFIATATTHGDGTATVQTELGEMEATVQGDPPGNDQRSLTIVRPENIVIGEAAIDRDNVYEATFVDWTYMGKETEYAFEVDELDYTLQAIRDGMPAVSDEDIGSKMSLGWDREDTLCFGRLSSEPTVTLETMMED